MTNTKNILIAQRYSEALVEFAKEGKLSYMQINDNLNVVKEILQNSSDLNEFLSNPLISIEDKIEVIGKVFSSEVDVLIVNFLKLLVEKERFSVFYDILDSFSKSLDNVNNICRVGVTSAVQMNEDAVKRLKEKLDLKLKKNVVLNLDINPDIIAGLVLKIGDNIIDMSLRHKLEDLGKNITR